MNGPCTVQGNSLNESKLHQIDQDRTQARFYYMCAHHQQDRFIIFPGRDDMLHQGTQISGF